MKLYTEEQVRKTFFEGIKYAASIVPSSMGEQDKYVQNTINSLIPIELPSDREIENNAYTDRRVEDLEYHEQIGFERGANWMKEQILNQNK